MVSPYCFKSVFNLIYWSLFLAISFRSNAWIISYVGYFSSPMYECLLCTIAIKNIIATKRLSRYKQNGRKYAPVLIKRLLWLLIESLKRSYISCSSPWKQRSNAHADDESRTTKEDSWWQKFNYNSRKAAHCLFCYRFRLATFRRGGGGSRRNI